MMAWAMGCMPPPPIPWRMRQRSRMGRVGAAPQRKLETVKMMMQSRKKLRRPMTVEIQPPMGRTMALATR